MKNDKTAQEIPKRYQKFFLDSFFQTDVDVFHDGEFMFLSAKKIKTKTNVEIHEKIESFDEFGWVISTYCYTYSRYYKIFLCEFRPKPWENNYMITAAFSDENGCDGYSLNYSLTDFIDWIEYIDNPSVD